MIDKFIYKIINPQLLQRIDRNLLLNHPKLWPLKLQYICYYTLLANVLISFIVFGFIPIFPIYDILKYLIPGLVILSIVLVYYWWHRQSLFNIEKQYSNTHKSNGFLEILSYSVCIFLMFSLSLVFYFSMELKVAILVPQTELSIDLLMLDAVDTIGRSSLSNNDYFKALKTYLYSPEFKKQQKESIFFDNHNTRNNSQRQRDSMIRLCLRHYNLRDF